MVGEAYMAGACMAGGVHYGACMAGDVCGRGACMARGHAWQGTCMAGKMATAVDGTHIRMYFRSVIQAALTVRAPVTQSLTTTTARTKSPPPCEFTIKVYSFNFKLKNITSNYRLTYGFPLRE